MAENISTKSNLVLTKSITITKFRHYQSFKRRKHKARRFCICEARRKPRGLRRKLFEPHNI